MDQGLKEDWYISYTPHIYPSCTQSTLMQEMAPWLLDIDMSEGKNALLKDV